MAGLLRSGESFCKTPMTFSCFPFRHPTVQLAAWCAGVVMLQWLHGVWLLPAVVASLTVVALQCPQRGWRLVRRSRFLLLAIAIFFAWGTPGEALWYRWPTLSPSREGTVLAVEHMARLLAIMLWVAWLLHHFAPARLVAALLDLLQPLDWLGLPVERAALRILLVLQFVETAGFGHKDWRRWLVEESGPVALVSLQVQRLPLGRCGQLALGVIAVLTVLAARWLA